MKTAYWQRFLIWYDKGKINKSAKGNKMTKMQKVWLIVFLGMFLVPEIFWSPVGNQFYQFYNTQFGNTHPFRMNFLNNPDNANILSTILFVQFVGLLASFVYLLIIHKSIQNKVILWASCLLLFLATVVIFFLFGFSVSLRHIGF